MSTVRYDMSMSLDGYVAGPDVTAEEGLGVGGERLHTWVISDPDEHAVALFAQIMERMGAMLTGRRNYDISQWGPDGPAGELRIPVFVLTHRVTPPPPEGSVYTFVADLEEAVALAKQAAGDKEVAVSGVSIGRQLIQAGLLDELSIHVVPVLFGNGTRLYEQDGLDQVELELVESVPTPNAVHLRYRVHR